MAWWNNIVDNVKKMWVEGSQKISKAAFDPDTFYDITNNVTAKQNGKEGFQMLNEARDTIKDELDTMSLKLYNNKYNIKSQEELEQAFNNLSDESFTKRLFNQQIYAASKGKGIFGEKYKNFDFSGMGKNLTEEQKKVLLDDFRIDYDEKLKDIYEAYVPDNKVLSKDAKTWIERYDGEVVDSAIETASINTPNSGTIVTNTSGNKTRGAVDTPLNQYNINSIDGPNSSAPLLLESPNGSATTQKAVELNEKARELNFNYGMQKKYINENVDVLDFATSADSVDMHGINKKINKSTYAEEIKAYRKYLNEQLMNVPDKSGTWKTPDSIYDYFTKQGYDANTVNQLNSEYNSLISKKIASGSPDHSGIGLWKKIGIGTAVAGATAWGISEVAEDDDF